VGSAHGGARKERDGFCTVCSNLLQTKPSCFFPPRLALAAPAWPRSRRPRGEDVTAESIKAITDLVEGNVSKIDQLFTINAGEFGRRPAH
jgi:hypothetical protein